MVNKNKKLVAQEDQYPNPYITTISGIDFYPLADEPEFSIGDIAHALAHIGRYNGHARFFYSVGQHSLMVSFLVEEWGGDATAQLSALLHDGTEAYMGDVASPLKQLLPDWKELDTKLDAKLRAYFKLPATLGSMEHYADQTALYIEAPVLIPNSDDWPDVNGVRQHAEVMANQGWRGMVRQEDPRWIRDEFLARYRRLTKGK